MHAACASFAMADAYSTKRDAARPSPRLALLRRHSWMGEPVSKWGVLLARLLLDEIESPLLCRGAYICDMWDARLVWHSSQDTPAN